LTPVMRLGMRSWPLAAPSCDSELAMREAAARGDSFYRGEVRLIDEDTGEFSDWNAIAFDGAQVRSGGRRRGLGKRATEVRLGEKIERGRTEDALVLSGRVSMGKYDRGESALKAMGSEFFFDAVNPAGSGGVRTM